MKSVSNFPYFGYYTGKENCIGTLGDFITSPEISQLFGEVLGCWYAHKMKAGLKYRILELGPGTGSLINDILRTFQSLKVHSQIEQIYFLENNQFFREKQRITVENAGFKTCFLNSIDDFHTMKSDGSIILAHEFFDALPIHSFLRNSVFEKWRELLIGFDQVQGLHMFPSPGQTFAGKLLKVDEMFSNEYTSIELSPMSWSFSSKLQKIGKASKHTLGLIVDYGQFNPSTHSIRAIKDHKILHNVFSYLGEADISVNVDFKALWFYLNSFFDCSFQNQREYLLSNGIQERFSQISKLSRVNLSADIKRLTDDSQMGSVYKILAFWTPEDQTKQ